MNLNLQYNTERWDIYTATTKNRKCQRVYLAFLQLLLMHTPHRGLKVCMFIHLTMVPPPQVISTLSVFHLTICVINSIVDVWIIAHVVFSFLSLFWMTYLVHHPWLVVPTEIYISWMGLLMDEKRPTLLVREGVVQKHVGGGIVRQEMRTMVKMWSSITSGGRSTARPGRSLTWSDSRGGSGSAGEATVEGK